MSRVDAPKPLEVSNAAVLAHGVARSKLLAAARELAREDLLAELSTRHRAALDYTLLLRRQRRQRRRRRLLLLLRVLLLLLRVLLLLLPCRHVRAHRLQRELLLRLELDDVTLLLRGDPPQILLR